MSVFTPFPCFILWEEVLRLTGPPYTKSYQMYVKLKNSEDYSDLEQVRSSNLYRLKKTIFLPLCPTAQGEILPSWTIFLHSSPSEADYLVSEQLIFMVWGCQPHAQPPTWRSRVSLFVWLLPLDLSDVGDPTSSYATASIALRISGALKPHHHSKVEVGKEDYLNCEYLRFLLWHIWRLNWILRCDDM
jgi:hypothetical protein